MDTLIAEKDKRIAELESQVRTYYDVIEKLQKRIAEMVSERRGDVLSRQFFRDQSDARGKKISALQIRIAELEAQLPKWHKVSEELPELGQTVWVYIEGKEKNYISDHKYNKGEIICNQRVTMWCELPQPPKEG